MRKKAIAALLLALILVTNVINVSASTIPQSGTTTITPNTLTITWEDESRAPVTINTFRFFGFNVAQLRTMVNAFDGVVNNLDDGSFQLSQYGASIGFQDITFHYQRNVEYIINHTPIRNHLGVLFYPNQPGWVFLPEYEYNWASVRDVIDTMDLALMDVIDDPVSGRTEVVVRTLDSSEEAPRQTGSPVLPPDTRRMRSWWPTDPPRTEECDDCNEYPCICPELCTDCDEYPCVCPVICPDCDEYPCVCPELCPDCDEYPCVCPELCPDCDEYPCVCPRLCPDCDEYPCLCPELCPDCDEYPCVCPELCPDCDGYPCVCICPECNEYKNNCKCHGANLQILIDNLWDWWWIHGNYPGATMNLNDFPNVTNLLPYHYIVPGEYIYRHYVDAMVDARQVAIDLIASGTATSAELQAALTDLEEAYENLRNAVLTFWAEIHAESNLQTLVDNLWDWWWIHGNYPGATMNLNDFPNVTNLLPYHYLISGEYIYRHYVDAMVDARQAAIDLIASGTATSAELLEALADLEEAYEDLRNAVLAFWADITAESNLQALVDNLWDWWWIHGNYPGATINLNDFPNVTNLLPYHYLISGEYIYRHYVDAMVDTRQTAIDLIALGTATTAELQAALADLEETYEDLRNAVLAFWAEIHAETNLQALVDNLWDWWWIHGNYPGATMNLNDFPNVTNLLPYHYVISGEYIYRHYVEAMVDARLAAIDLIALGTATSAELQVALANLEEAYEDLRNAVVAFWADISSLTQTITGTFTSTETPNIELDPVEVFPDEITVEHELVTDNYTQTDQMDAYNYTPTDSMNADNYTPADVVDNDSDVIHDTGFAEESRSEANNPITDSEI